MYQHGGDIYSNRIVMDFSVNTNPVGMPEAVKQVICDRVDAYEPYPDYACRTLTKALANRENVPKEAILHGNGAAELIYDVVRAKAYMQDHPLKACIVAPAFSEYERAVKAVRGTVEYYILKREKDFVMDEGDVEELGMKLEQNFYDVLFLASPSNPNGYRLNEELILKIYDKCAQNGTLMILDECFIEFTQKKSMSQFAAANRRDFSSLFILRAFTKIYAMAGIRLGYCICMDYELLERIKNIRQCWSVSTVAQEAGIAALDQSGDYVQKSVEQVSKWRKTLEEELVKLGFKVYPGEANFILFSSEIPGLKERLLKYGILIRDCSDYVGLRAGDYRIAVRRPEDNQKLLQILENLNEIYKSMRLT